MRSLLIAFMFFLALTASAFAREWRLKNGKTYEGVFSGVVDGMVEIDSNGTIRQIKITDLIEADQTYVGSLMKNSSPTSPAINSPTLIPNPTVNPNTNSAFELRDWKDSAGLTLRGRFGGFGGQNVTIVSTDSAGRDISKVIPFNSLSAVDQAYVTNLVSKVDPAVHARIWQLNDGQSIQASYVQIKNFDVWLMRSITEDRLSFPTQSLKKIDQDFVCISLDNKRPPSPLKNNKFRVWNYVTPSAQLIGRLAGYQSATGVVTLEQELELVAVNLVELSPTDQNFVADRFPEAASKMSGPTVTQSSEAEAPRLAGDYTLGVIVYVIFGFAVLALVGAVSFKYVRDSFQEHD